MIDNPTERQEILNRWAGYMTSISSALLSYRSMLLDARDIDPRFVDRELHQETIADIEKLVNLFIAHLADSKGDLLDVLTNEGATDE